MSNEITKSKIISSLLWKFMERGGTQGIQFIVMIILARILLPEEFGLIILVSIFITIAGVIAQSGFNTALIQKKKVDEIDFSSVFYLNLFVTTILYILLFITAPYIALFFDHPQLTLILRILSLTLFLGAFNLIQNAVIARNMEFKKLFFSSLGGVVISGVVGIVMAYANFGIWSLVVQQLTNQLIVTLTLWYTVKWKPKLFFSIERLVSLFSFGWKLLAAALIDTIYSNIRSLIIGKMFSPAILGFYNRGEQFPSLLIYNINGSIQSVIFPALSSQQDNKQRIKEMVRRSIVTSSFIVFPMMIGLAVIAEPLVKILLTEKWLPAVLFLQIFCAVYALWPIHTANLQAINALGRSDIFLKLEIVKKIIGITILIISIPLGVHAMAIGSFVGGVLAAIINAYPNLTLLNYSVKEQLKDILPSLLIALIMGAIVYSIQWLGLSDMVTITMQIFTGVAIYIGLAKIFRLECFIYLVMTLKEIFKRNKKVPTEEIY
ncbi:flippase [Lysinibacillus sp. 2017]|uniref:lipopolysaccharide biosynthesis protein n=1 Tax=unclassified Lysinibacillus TaxID=2636778 RepID=UPI000D526951|nr:MULTISPECIES: lipopolysaccharide biosynthesis protein [unclassified Lysinibacillus]AWE06764.1 flippase [Lysinibacillus sp. 2017]TGN37304.1 lipopolysaccharide biosynthesis protein [Lysinibacillus sp. S2017]